MGLFKRLLGREAPTKPAPSQNLPEQAVLIHLGPQDGLTIGVKGPSDLWTIEDQLTKILEEHRLGEFDGNDVGMDGTATLYIYGPDAERMFTAIEMALREYPLTRKARVEIRPGGPETPSREVWL